ncbi:MAG: methyltransferase domain-containing protein [Patescibacteria group bacterium]
MVDFLKMDEVLSHLDLKEDMIAAEFGCGGAMFTISLSKILSKGRVYALDIQEAKLSALKGKTKQQKINNIFTVLCDLEAKNGSTLQDNSLDIVLMPNLLFQAEDKNAIVEEAKRVLKTGGQLLIIDWLRENSFGPQKIIKPDEVKKIASSLGLSFKKEFVSGDYHYALLFTKH